MGSQLISKEILSSKNYTKLTEDVKSALEIIKKVR
jgi:2-dehydro-3-deoxyphosphogluconate aldolase/(4S)-4-hydroxy-2-oxoglutarate aldolase